MNSIPTSSRRWHSEFCSKLLISHNPTIHLKDCRKHQPKKGLKTNLGPNLNRANRGSKQRAKQGPLGKKVIGTKNTGKQRESPEIRNKS